MFLLLAVTAATAQIRVLKNFEGGQIGEVEFVGPSHLRCPIPGQADQDHRNRQANWYYFELTNLPKSPVTVDLTNLAGEYDYRAPAYAVTKGTRPVYSYDRVNWQHFSDDQVRYDDAVHHLTLTFTPTADHIWIAHVPPYTNRDLTSLLDSFRGSPFLAKKTIGRTVHGRDLLLLSVTNPKVAEAQKRVVWLMFRQHAWEAGSSWAGDGAIRYLLSDGQKAGILDRIIFQIFPICDPDGVAEGGVRYNRNGFDLNRNWDAADPKSMPEIAAQKKAIFDWLDAGHRLDLFLTLHNTETNEYLQAPLAAFRPIGQRFFDRLSAESTFNPTSPLRDLGDIPSKGRANVAQDLFQERKLPAMLMEQMIENNSKLKHCPTAADRREFGAALIRVLTSTVE